MLKDNQWLKIRPLTIEQLGGNAEEEAIEFVLYESDGEVVYERTTAALDVGDGFTLRRLQANLDYVANKQPEPVDRFQAEYSFTPQVLSALHYG